MFGFLKKGKSSGKALSDAKKIIKSVNKEALESAWDVYVHIKKEHPEQYDDFDQQTYEILTHTWEGLNKLIKYKGDFTKFTDEEEHFLTELRDGHLAYADVIHVLIDHHDDKKEAEYLFEKHPKLHKVIPKEYDNARQVIEVLLEIVKDYQWQLEHFAMEHYGEIEDALGEDHDEDDVYVMPN